MTKRYSISKPRKYVKDGVEKTYWDKVGEMVEFQKEDGSVSRIIKIPAIGLEANVFEEKPREAPAAPSQPTVSDTGEINPDEIPF